MARTIYFLDGTKEVLFHDDGPEMLAQSFERMISERLGPDAAALLKDITDGELNGIADMEQEMKNYEMSCDSYRACLQDVSDSMDRLLKLLSAHRIDRRKFILTLQAIKARISNEL